MQSICPKCLSFRTYPIPFTAQSQSVFSPVVLAGIGSSICKSCNVHPAIGVAVGLAVGVGVSMVQDKKSIGFGTTGMLYCGNCHHVFSPEQQVN